MLENVYYYERRSIYRLTKGDNAFLKIHNTPGIKGNKVVNRYTYSFTEIGAKYAVEQGFCKAVQGFNGYQHSLQSEKNAKELLDKGIDISNIYNEKEQEILFKNKIK